MTASVPDSDLGSPPVPAPLPVWLEDPQDFFPPPAEPPVDPHGELLPARVATVSMTRRLVLIVAGIVLIILGIIGWLLPVMTGVPFWVAGLICLSQASERCRRLINFGDSKLPGRVRGVLRWARDKTGLHKRSSPEASAEPPLPPTPGASGPS